MPKVPENFGTIDHMQELDDILHELDSIRRHLGNNDRKERFTISRAMDSIKTLKARSKRFGVKSGLLDEDNK